MIYTSYSRKQPKLRKAPRKPAFPHLSFFPSLFPSHMCLKHITQTTVEASGWEGNNHLPFSQPLLRNCTSYPRRGQTSLWWLEMRGAPLQGAAAERMRASQSLLCLAKPEPPPSSLLPVPRRQKKIGVALTAKVVRREGAEVMKNACEGKDQRTGIQCPIPAFKSSDSLSTAADSDCIPVVCPAMGHRPFCWTLSICSVNLTGPWENPSDPEISYL